MKLQDERPAKPTRTVPHYGIPFQPQLQPKFTDPEPFTFEERERARAVKKTQKIEEVFEQEKLVRNILVQNPAYLDKPLISFLSFVGLD